VAKAHSLRGTRDGDEVRRVMDEALGACGSPVVPAAVPAGGESYGMRASL